MVVKLLVSRGGVHLLHQAAGSGPSLSPAAVTLLDKDGYTPLVVAQLELTDPVLSSRQQEEDYGACVALLSEAANALVSEAATAADAARAAAEAARVADAVRSASAAAALLLAELDAEEAAAKAAQGRKAKGKKAAKPAQKAGPAAEKKPPSKQPPPSSPPIAASGACVQWAGLLRGPLTPRPRLSTRCGSQGEGRSCRGAGGRCRGVGAVPPIDRCGAPSTAPSGSRGRGRRRRGRCPRSVGWSGQAGGPVGVPALRV